MLPEDVVHVGQKLDKQSRDQSPPPLLSLPQQVIQGRCRKEEESQFA